MVILLQSQINITSSILLLIILGHAYFKMNRRLITNRLFMWIIGLTWFTLILEVLSIILNDSHLKEFLVLHKLVNVMGFMIAPSIPFLGYEFCKEWVNRYQKEKIKVNYLLLLPIFINGLGTLLSYNGGELFYITSENIYERGPLFFILPCVSYIYFGYTLYFLYRQRKRFTVSELVIFSLFFIIPAVLTLIQLKYSIYLTTWNGTAIIIVVTYIFILNEQVYRDSLTGLGNRLSFEHYVQNIGIKKLNKLSIVYIDIDEFKTINDLYGHGAGDEAIKSFAHLLVESFPLRQKKIIRLGGDEFIILLEWQPRDRVLAYIQNFAQQVDTYNNTQENPYRLGFSYGMAFYTDVSESIYQLLETADQLMYEQKRSKKCKG